MPSVASQMAAAVIAVVAVFLSLAAIINNRWAVEWRSRDTLQQQSDGHYFGLWMRCEHQPTGASICDHYDNFVLGSSLELVGTRAGMLIGVLLQFVAICLMTCAVDCANLVDGPKRKKKLRMICGIMVTVSGVLILAVSIMMVVVIGKQYHQTMYYMTYQGYQGGNQGYPPNQGRLGRDVDTLRVRRLAEAGNKAMKFGPGVYLALLAGLTSVVSGGMMLCQGCGRSDEGEYYDEYQQGNETRGIVRETESKYL
jgi:hypothetical protein